MTSAFLDYRNPPPLFDVGNAWAILWRRRATVLAIAVAVVALAVGYIAITKPTYTATAAILFDPREVRGTSIDSVLPGIGTDSAAIASQVSVIQSRDLLSKVFEDLGLETDPEYSGQGLTSSLLGFLRIPSPRSSESVFQRFQRTIAVEREGLTYVIDVSVKSGDAQKAARIANAIVERYIAGAAAQRTDVTADVTIALNDKIADLQDDVSSAEREVDDFKTQHNIIDDASGGTLQSQVNQLSSQLIAAQDQLNTAQTKYDQAVEAGTSPQAMARLSDISSSPATDQLRNDYNARAATLASAEATFGPKHPTIITARAELSKVEGLMEREAGRIVKQLKSDLDLAKANLDKLQADLESLRQQSTISAAAEVELRQLQRRADAARSVLSDFLQRSQETSQLQGLQNSQVHVISGAVPPPDATWPKPMLLLPVSTALGLLLGSGVALMLGDREHRRPVPPAPVTPDRPRDQPARPVRSTPVRQPVSSAKRFAGLDSARSEMLSGHETPMTMAVQQLLKQVLGALQGRRKPYLLTFSALNEREVAEAGLVLASLGLDRIGASALVLDDGKGFAPRAEAYDFILVRSSHPLAAHADLDILVLAAGEENQLPADAMNRVRLTLGPAGPVSRPHIVASNGNAARLATG